jgi:hypothetical protein
LSGQFGSSVSKYYFEVMDNLYRAFRVKLDSMYCLEDPVEKFKPFTTNIIKIRG